MLILKHAEVNTTVLIPAKNFDKMPNVEAMLFSKIANLEKILVPLPSALVEKLCKLAPPHAPSFGRVLLKFDSCCLKTLK